MADIVSAEKRSQMMSGIRGKNTKPELLVRKGLHSLGFRYRIHADDLPGKPDIVFPKHRAIIFVHGCFWHGHSCSLFRMPSSREEFWRSKLARNQEVDVINFKKLRQKGWRIGIVWECSIKGKKKHNFKDVIEACRDWLLSQEPEFEIRSFV